MKPIFTLVAALSLSCAPVFAQQVSEASILPPNFKPWNIQQQYDHSQLEALARQNHKPGKQQQAVKVQKNKVKRLFADAVEEVQYNAAVQTYRVGTYGSFNYEGGDVNTYNVGVTVDGTKVTFTNMFNLYDPTAYSPSRDLEVVGTYDAASKTITIPTSTNFADATVCADVWDGYYVGTLLCGEVDTDGTLTPAPELVLHVDGDFDAIYADQTMAVGEYSQNGATMYGYVTTLRNFRLSKPTAPARLIAFNDSFEFGETFVTTPVSKNFTLINTGAEDIDFAIDLVSDDDSYTADPIAGTVAANSTLPVSFTLLSANPGEYEGLANVTYEAPDGADVDPLLVQLNGAVTDYPDYSPAVKEGEFTFTTNLDAPFEITTLDDGTKVASSGTHGKGGVSSKLNTTFTVPEGHIGTFSWKGVTNNTSTRYYNYGGVIIDGASESYIASAGVNADISGSVEFAPGQHTVTFQYDSNYYTGDETDRVYVYDISLVNVAAPADAVVPVKESLDMGSFIVKDGIASGDNTITLQNRGQNELKVTAVKSSTSEFVPALPATTVGTLATLDVPVKFTTEKAGAYEAVITITTSAGEVEVPVKAFVRDMPDFASLVTAGAEYMTFSTDEAYPFIVENGVAYNANSGEIDYEASISQFTVEFEIPEGKAGRISWKAQAYGHDGNTDNDWSRDVAYLEMGHPMNTYTNSAWSGDQDFGSDALYVTPYGNDDALICVPGKHYLTFMYKKMGDGVIESKDRLEVSNINLDVFDFTAKGVEAMQTEVEFDSTYVGPQRYTTATIQLKNTGSERLSVLENPASEPFYSIETTYTADFNKTIDVTLWFYPSEVGEFTKDLVLKTSAGDVTIKCHGVAKDSEGMLLIGDVEDNGYNWGAFDRDGDGDSFDLGFNFFAGHYPEWVHGGKECFASASYSYYNGNITPDNWLISPYVDIPEDGAMLRWYAAPHSSSRAAEHYSVYVMTADDIEDSNVFNTAQPMFSETLEPGQLDDWSEQTLDLTPWANETIVLAWRHHDCTGQYLLKLDDMNVYTMDKWNRMATGIDRVKTNGSVKPMATEVYNLSGARTNGFSKGINIVREQNADGTVTTKKIIR